MNVEPQALHQQSRSKKNENVERETMRERESTNHADEYVLNFALGKNPHRQFQHRALSLR